MLRGIDIASWQAGIVPSETDTDFVIVKATGGTWYENPYFEGWVEDVLASGKLLGIYHYAVESQKNANAQAEAEYFLSHVRKYKGRFIPFLDWESDAMDYPQEWAREWMDIVADELGATPVFYGYASHLNSKDYSLVAEKYPLWMASYLNRYDGVGWGDNPNNAWGFGSWKSMLMYQYTSTGRIAGYDRDLDLNVFYGTREDWQRMCGGLSSQQDRQQETLGQVRYLLSRSHMAAEVMWHLVTCPRHGYSQYHREGDGTWEELTLSDGTTVTIRGGDKDCSESVRLCYEAAGVLGGYWESYIWTGIEDEVLRNAGFVLVSLGDAQVGDVLWREGHTELVIEVGGKLMQAGFRRSETGGKDGETGDQDGLESTYSEYHPWEWARCYRYAGPERPGYGKPIYDEEEELEGTMECIIRPNGRNYHVYIVGDQHHDIANTDEEEAIKMAYRNTNKGREIPVFDLGNERDPWATRFLDVLDRAPQRADREKVKKN